MAQSLTLPQFEGIFKKHHKELCDLAYNLVRDQDSAKDIVQDVFIKVWRNRDKIEFGNQLKAYLFKATTHTAYNHLRSFRRILRLDDATDLENKAVSPQGAEDPGFWELEHVIQNAISRLPPKCRVIYQLSRQEDLTYQQIADTLNLSIKTVENQMSIALSKLRTQLQPYLTPEFLILLASLAFLAKLLLERSIFF